MRLPSSSAWNVYTEHRRAMLREETLKARPSKPGSHATAIVGVNAELGWWEMFAKKWMSLEDMHLVISISIWLRTSLGCLSHHRAAPATHSLIHQST